MLHEGTDQTYRRWLSYGAVTSELPTMATSCTHTGQVYLDLLHVFRCRLLGAAEMLTDLVRSSAYTRTEHSTRKVSWTNSTSREQHAGDFDVSRFTPSVYEACSKNSCYPACEVRSSAYTRYRDGTQHVEDILDRIRPAIKKAQAIWMSVAHKEHQRYSARGHPPNFAQLYSPTGINA